MDHFIHLILRLFSRNTSENADVIESTLGVLHNIVHSQKPRKYPKTSEERTGTPTSCHVTFGHVTSGHAQSYILSYYYSKKKAREKSGIAQNILPVRSLPADVIESTLGVLHNITKNLENIRKHAKKGRETPTSGFMTSLLVTLTGHFRSHHIQ
jgi:hypothetical protein